jgi:hypothetical protein
MHCFVEIVPFHFVNSFSKLWGGFNKQFSTLQTVLIFIPIQ